MSSYVQFFLLSFLAEASKISETLSFWLKNGLEFFLTLSFFGLEFFENGQKKPDLGGKYFICWKFLSIIVQLSLIH